MLADTALIDPRALVVGCIACKEARGVDSVPSGSSGSLYSLAAGHCAPSVLPRPVFIRRCASPLALARGRLPGVLRHCAP
jgi:hypothetical protein